MEKEAKQLFKTIFEYSLSVEKEHQTLWKHLKKELNDVEPEDLNLKETILKSIFYDFFKKAITLNETKEMLKNILKQNGTELLLIPLTDDNYFQDTSNFIIPDLAQNAYITDILKTLIQWINDDEWLICFFTDYIHEMLSVSKMSKEIPSLEKVDWEKCLIAFLMEEITGKAHVY